MTTEPTEKELMLLPCPFCGNEAVLKKDGCGMYCVCCTKCLAKIGESSDRDGADDFLFNSSKEAIEAWNRRSEPSKPTSGFIVGEDISNLNKPTEQTIPYAVGVKCVNGTIVQDPLVGTVKMSTEEHSRLMKEIDQLKHEAYALIKIAHNAIALNMDNIKSVQQFGLQQFEEMIASAEKLNDMAAKQRIYNTDYK